MGGQHGPATASESSGNLKELVVQGFRNFGTVEAAGDFSRAAAMAEQLLDIAKREGSPASLAFAHHAQLDINFYSGNLVDSLEDFKRWYAVYEAPDYRQFVGAHILAMGVGALAELASGQVGSARRHLAEAVANAHAGHNPYELAFARFYECCFYLQTGEMQRAEEASNEALALAEQHDFPQLCDLCLTNAGWIQAKLGSPSEGAATIKEGHVGLSAIGIHISSCWRLYLRADALLLAGAIDDALASVEDALESSASERVYQPAILMLRGEIRLKLRQPGAAETDFRDGIVLARKMSWRLAELRISVRLARFLCDTGRRGEARAMLAGVYGRFTEGFDIADSKDAKALLEELRAQPKT